MSFVCLLEIHLHFPENGSLKGKRKELQSLKAQLQRRFGAAVSETDHHDLWQRPRSPPRSWAEARPARGRRGVDGALCDGACFPTACAWNVLVSGDELLDH